MKVLLAIFPLVLLGSLTPWSSRNVTTPRTSPQQRNATALGIMFSGKGTKAAIADPTDMEELPDS